MLGFYWLSLLWVLPAIVSGSIMVAHLLPFKLDVRFTPLLTFLVALVAMNLPVMVGVALALTLPVAIIQKFLGLQMTGHDPVKVPKVDVRKAVARVKPKPKVDVTEFVKPGGFPSPEDQDKIAEAAQEPGPEIKVPESRSSRPRVRRLLDE